MSISVILCTYNPSESCLSRSLDSILGQDLCQDEWELIVIDNNSSFPVKEWELVKERGVRVEFEGKQGLAAARYSGVKHSTGEILVFVDDDNILASDYLKHVKAIFQKTDIGIVSGTVLPEYQSEPAAWFKEWESMLAIRKPYGEKAYLTTIPFFNEYFPIGAGMSVRRNVIEGYYEAIANGSAYITGRVGAQLSSAEDIDLDFFAINQGYLVGTVGVLKMKHIIPAGRTTVDYISRLAVASTRSAAEVNQKWKDFFGANIFSFFNISKTKIIIKMLVSLIFVWKPGYKVRFVFYRTLLDILSKA